MSSTASETLASNPKGSRRSAVTRTAGAVLAASAWPALWARKFGGFSSLAPFGPSAPAYPLLHHDLPQAHVFPGPGHDGQQFYAIARFTFHLSKTRSLLDHPAYRMRRILFPLLAHIMAPNGGPGLVLALLAVSLVGVGIGAFALTQLPGAPPWLPFTMAVNPGVIAALTLSLADALCAGLTLACLCAGVRRRWVLAVTLATLACLAHETAIIACLALPFAPSAPRWFRAAIVAGPLAALGLWTGYLSVLTRTWAHPQPPLSDNLNWPLWGWLHGPWSLADRGPTLAVAALILAALVLRPKAPLPIRLFQLGTLGLLAISAVAPTQHWIDGTRILITAMPLAFWMLARRPDRVRPVSRPLAAPA